MRGYFCVSVLSAAEKDSASVLPYFCLSPESNQHGTDCLSLCVANMLIPSIPSFLLLFLFPLLWLFFPQYTRLTPDGLFRVLETAVPVVFGCRRDDS